MSFQKQSLFEAVLTTFSPLLSTQDLFMHPIHLQLGESKNVQFNLTPIDLSVADSKGKRTIESGDFQVLLGNSSEDIRLKQRFHLD